MEEAWLIPLGKGDCEKAWDLFLSSHRGLILATVRHYVQDYDDVMDVFARVCERLRADSLARLRRYTDKPQETHTATFSTWLVAVLRNLVIDWFRHRDGRKQVSNAARTLPPLHRHISRAPSLLRARVLPKSPRRRRRTSMTPRPSWRRSRLCLPMNSWPSSSS